MINPTDKKRFNQEFTIQGFPLVRFFGFLHNPPQDIRYNNPAPARILETGLHIPELAGKQVISIGATKARYIVGNFQKNFETLLHQCFEVNYHASIIRGIPQLHPVTQLPTGKDLSEVTPDCWFYTTFDFKNLVYDQNPTKSGTIRSSIELRTGDIIGDFLVRNVWLDQGIWNAQVDYHATKKPV